MRVYRILPILMAMLAACALAQRISIEIGFLGLSCALMYAGFGLLNAIKDGDYPLPAYSRTLMIACIAGAILISFIHPLILLTNILWIVFGWLYHGIGRHILFGDATILSFTHFALPSFISSQLLNQSMLHSARLSLFFFLVFWFVIPSKNMKDSEKDRKLRYSTFSTQSPYGVLLSLLFLVFSYLIMIGGFVVFDFGVYYRIALLLSGFVLAYIFYLVSRSQLTDAVNTVRLWMLLFLLGFILEQHPLWNIAWLSLIPIVCYLFFLPFLGNADSRRTYS